MVKPKTYRSRLENMKKKPCSLITNSTKWSWRWQGYRTSWFSSLVQQSQFSQVRLPNQSLVPRYQLKRQVNSLQLKTLTIRQTIWKMSVRCDETSMTHLKKQISRPLRVIVWYSSRNNSKKCDWSLRRKKRHANSTKTSPVGRTKKSNGPNRKQKMSKLS